MKRLVFFLTWAFSSMAFTQSYNVKNANDEYFVSSIFNTDISKYDLLNFVRDKEGLYWFQYLPEVYSFDGVNWRSYQIRSLKNKPFRINDIATTEDGSIWLGTEHGIYVFDPASEMFVSIKQKFPGITNIPPAVKQFFKGPPGTLLFTGFEEEGFFLFDWRSKRIQQVVLDRKEKIFISSDWYQVVADQNDNIWGTTKDLRGIWHYNRRTGKLSRSWKGELPQFASKRFQQFLNLTYSAKENSLWITYRQEKYLEKINLLTWKSDFYSFSGNLKVQADTSATGKYQLGPVKIDRDNNEWVNVESKFLVRLDPQIGRMIFLSHDWGSLPIGDFKLFKPEMIIPDDRNNILLWVTGYDRMSMIKKRDSGIRHIYFDSLLYSIVRGGSTVADMQARQNSFFEKGREDQYFILQQDPGQAKLICLDRDFRLRKVLLNDSSKKYPAYFPKDFDPDTLYIALLRPGVEPLDFRHVVMKDIRVDLNTLQAEEVQLDFKQRVWKYGSVDKYGIYWLFSAGKLFSYDKQNDRLDSVFICNPQSKKPNSTVFVKGYDYPSLLHFNSSTFWISFYPNRELYKINLETRKIEKIFKTCLDQADCTVAGAVHLMYNFDSTYIYLRSGLFGGLMNTRTDSITDFSALYHREIPIGSPAGVGYYRNWTCLVMPGMIFLQNRLSGIQKVLVVGEDFKWKLATFKSRPLVNDRGEMILVSNDNRGFLIFNIDSAISRKKPGTVNYSFVRVDNKNLPIDSLFKKGGLHLKYNHYNNIQIAFSDYSVFIPEKIHYEYAMYKRGDTLWNKINGRPEITFSDLSPGKYRLLLRASNIYGDYSEKINSLGITIRPPYWQTAWFRALVLGIMGLIFYGLYLYRMQQLKRLQVVRNNIASDLHDDIGSTLNSISIYSEVARQQAGKEIPALDLIGDNSRKIIESMSDIVWTINPENDSFEKIITRMRSFAHQMLKAKKVEYTFEADEKLNRIVLPMQVRKNFYLVFKEAITNVVKYSEASRVSISLGEDSRNIVLKIRDNGKGIPVNANMQGNGLLNMNRRAEEIKAELSIVSAQGEGTEIELMLKN